MAGDTRVRRLPDALVDQIAAGEVVERPASVVKELVENALDAGARRIRVDVREGGTSLIAVTDDGRGMPQGDAELALERHATSKIHDADDLEAIASFGFRGEALPAIASVSRLRLTTRPEGASEGWEIRVEGGRTVDARASGGPTGTRVEVADLFGAVPARRKFLKKPPTEWGHIKDWLGRLAIALPGVHFELRRDDRPAVVWPATDDPLARIAAVLGEETASILVPVVFESAGGHVEAWLSGPEHARTNAGGLHLFVNGRPIRDAVLRHALLDAYRDLLPRGRFPTAVLFLTVPPGSIDVNVHPAKWEVRFAEPRSIHELVRHCVRQAMSERRWLGADAAMPEPTTPGSVSSAGPTTAPARRVPTAARAPEPATPDWILAADARRAAAPADRFEAAGADRVADREQGDRISFGSLRVVGQLLASYLLVESKHGLVLVDQHAAHERILYERLRAEWLETGVARQPLLVPETVEMEPLALAALQDNETRCARLGFDLEIFGESSALVRAIPALLAGHNPAELVRGLARELQQDEPGHEGGAADTRLLHAADRVFATLACHSARRFGDHLEPGEQRAILEGLDQIPWAPCCPHGRPVAISLDVAEIERRFGRR